MESWSHAIGGMESRYKVPCTCLPDVGNCRFGRQGPPSTITVTVKATVIASLGQWDL